MSFGTLVNLDTRGTAASGLSVGDEDWAAGTILYAHPTVAGKLTSVRPQHDLAVGFTTVRNATSGQIAIRIVPGNFHLEWLHDVVISEPIAGDVLTYNSETDVWENSQVVGPTGPTGPQGETGLPGPVGDIGPIGPAGADGADGADGLDGATGPTGDTGPAGENGLNGLTGDTGPTGPQGLAGFAWDVDRVTPNGYVVGDIVNYLGTYYICIANNDAIVPTSSGGLDYWIEYSFVGPTGPQGEQGPGGAQGPGFEVSYTGDYNPSSTYFADNYLARGSDGQIYIAKETGELGNPIDYLTNAQWEIWIPKGADGATGPTGPTGPAPTGASGSFETADFATVTVVNGLITDISYD
jgi:hypothetical protein